MNEIPVKRVTTRCQNKYPVPGIRVSTRQCQNVATDAIGSLHLCAYHAAMMRPWAEAETKPDPELCATEHEKDLCRLVYYTDLSFSEKIRKVDELNKFYTFAQ
jgi:hypothetical protein